MNPYMFVIRSIPLPNNENYKTVRQALVHIWVFSDSLKSAQESAVTYIRSLNWNPQKVEHAFEILQEQISHLGKEESLLYQKASIYGIAAEFLASPLREKSPDSPVEIRNP